MTTLNFTDTHNMVAFLSKTVESEGFKQIVDFLNAQPIKHALMVNPTIYTLCIEQLWATIKAKTANGEVRLQALVDGKKIIITESTVRRDLQLEDAEGVDCLPNATIFEQLALMRYEQVSQKLTFYIAFFSLQWKFLIPTVLQCLSSKRTTWNEFSSTMAFAIICLATNQKFNFSRGNTLRSGEDSIKLNELMELCTNLQQRVLDLETTKKTQANKIVSLKRRVKKLEKKDRSRTHKLKRLYKVGLSARVESSRDEEDLGKDASKQGRMIHDIDADEEITLVNDNNEIFDVDALAGKEVFIAEQSGNVVEEVVAVIDAANTILVSAATITDVEITLAQALAKLKSAKPKADKVVIQEPNIPLHEKGKGNMIEEHVVEQVKHMKRLEQMTLDEELAFKLQAEEEEEEEERLTREKA
ncbi:hypothetical protein Tco_0167465 [Tanacetum coccineum]